MANQSCLHLSVDIANNANCVVAASDGEKMRFQLAESEKLAATYFCFSVKHCIIFCVMQKRKR